MDEYIDILDAFGYPLHKTCLKSQAHRYGYFHASVHIWFYTSKGEVLLQKRAANKDTYPNLWDVSVAGHIAAGEQKETSALREIAEEIGVNMNQNQLTYQFTTRNINKHPNAILDCEYKHIFTAQLPVAVTALQLQEEEVAGLQLLSISDFEAQLNLQQELFVPRPAAYYQKIIALLKTEIL